MADIPFHLNVAALWQRMTREAYRTKDRMHLRDMIDVDLIDDSWCNRLPRELAARSERLDEELQDYPACQ
jgi:hypothetical protein